MGKYLKWTGRVVGAGDLVLGSQVPVEKIDDGGNVIELWGFQWPCVIGIRDHDESGFHPGGFERSVEFFGLCAVHDCVADAVKCECWRR